MHYSESIGSFTNDFLEKILDTDLRYNVPYTFDREKYASIAEKYGLQTNINETKTISFSADYDDDCDFSEHGTRTFFVWPESGMENLEGGDWHDVFFFGEYHDLSLKDYEHVVKDILGCVTGVNIRCVGKLLDERIQEANRTIFEIQTLRKIMRGDE